VKRASKAARALAAAGLLLASSCAQLLGIEDARVDPTLEPTNGGSTSGTSGISGALDTPAATAGTTNAAAGEGGGSHAHPPTAGSGGTSATEQPSSDSAGAAGTTSTEPDLCERYCDQITRVCKGKYEQYRTFDQCVAVCKRLPAGTPGDQDVNSVECRLRQAQFADSEPFVYCKSAGPLGAGKCGSNCVSYCSLMQEECTAQSTAQNLEPSFYPSVQACLSACSALPDEPGAPTQYSSSAMAEPSSFVGNNVFCRTYHVAAALEQDAPDEHCPHAMGGDPCISQ